jgi:hypothetical protein
MTESVEPVTVVEAVEDYVTSELRDQAKYENRHPLDESGIYSLHVLATGIYTQGWIDGCRAANARSHAQRMRDTEGVG